MEQSKKSFTHTILLAMLLYVIKMIVLSWGNISLPDMGKAMLYSSGVPVRETIPALGAMWFLVVLFFCRCLADLLHLCLEKWYSAAIAVLTIVGVLLGSCSVWLPFSFDIALASLFFFWIGHQCKPHIEKLHGDTRKCRITGLSAGLVWAATLLVTYLIFSNYLEFATRDYPMFPICFFTAVAGVIVCICAAQQLKHLAIINNALKYIGNHSIVLYSVHYMDDWLKEIWTVDFSNGFIETAVRVFLRLLIDLTAFLLYCS